MTDPRSWGAAIREAGPSYAVIFALIALLGYLAVQGVPAVMALTVAIQHNTDTVADTARDLANAQTATDSRQQKELDNEATMIEQHGELISLLKTYSIETDDLWADKKARDAHAALRAH